MLRTQIERNQFLMLLVISCIGVSILSWTYIPELTDFYANTNPTSIVNIFTEYTLFQLLHTTPMHLFGNLLLLVFIWDSFCGKIQTKYLLPFYFGTGIFVYSALLFMNTQPTAGLSGYVYAIFGYMFVIFLKERNPEFKAVLLFVGLFGIIDSMRPNISIVAHLSGFISGVIMSAIFQYLLQKKSK